MNGEKKRILARFKITELGGTDWVPIIFGARAIDCVEPNGLGFMPGPHSHFLAALGLQIERVEEENYEWAGPDARYKESKELTVYAIKAGVFDEPDGEIRFRDDSIGTTGTPLTYVGEPLMLAPSEAVWVPVEVSGPLPAGEAQQVVLATDQTALDAVPGRTEPEKACFW